MKIWLSLFAGCVVFCSLIDWSDACLGSPTAVDDFEEQDEPVATTEQPDDDESVGDKCQSKAVQDMMKHIADDESDSMELKALKIKDELVEKFGYKTNPQVICSPQFDFGWSVRTLKDKACLYQGKTATCLGWLD